MIEFRSVGFIYPNGVRSLSSLNITIQKGEFVFITGPTGAGKSTALRMLYRELVPTTGEIWVNGTNVGTLPSGKVPYLRRKIGVVFEDFKLLNNRTTFQNVAYALEVVGAERREIQRKVARVLKLVGLTHKAFHRVEELSGGEQQRTAIARAIVNGSSILVADEPTGHLDAETGWDIMQLFSKIHEEGATVVVATHNLHWIERMGKRVVFVYEGESIEKFVKGANQVHAPNNTVLSP